MSVSRFQELKNHVGHEFDCVIYGEDDNVSLECLTCSEVIMDFNHHDCEYCHEHGLDVCLDCAGDSNPRVD